MVLKTFLLMLALTLPSLADSPLTSTDIWEAYQDMPNVVLARKVRLLDSELGAYLLSPISIDRKAAVINALSWDIKGKDNAQRFRKLLEEKYCTPQFDSRLSAQESFCLGYLMALDHYQDVSAALPYLEAARKALPKSFTVAIVTALAQAQQTSDFEAATAIVQRVLQNRSLRQDLRGRSRELIAEYFAPL